MPKKVLPTAAEFAAFFTELENRGFRRSTAIELASSFKRLGLVAPSPREGRSVGYTFTANGLTVTVWTTCLEEGVARESAAGWVLITEGDRRKYVTRPIHRTKNFLRTLLGHARIARMRVLHRPGCPVCRRLMDVLVGKGLKSRFWGCVKHGQYQSWDLGLSDEALAFLRPIRRRHERYRAQLRARGQEPGAALRRRRGWVVSRPENRL